MKTEYSDTPRASEPLPAGLRAFVRSRQIGPDDAAMDRMAKRLATVGVLSTKRSANRQTSAHAKSAWHAAGFLAVAGVLALAWEQTERPFAVTREQAPSMTARPSAPEIVSPKSELPVTQVAPAPEPARLPDAISVNHLPAARPLARGIGSAPNAARKMKLPAEGTEAAPSATEFELVQRAQAALASDANRALTLANEHAVAYPKGELVEEREVIAIEALAQLGRSEEASRRSLAFVRRFPETPYTARLEKAIGRPLPEPSGASTAETSARSRSTSTP